MIIEKRKKREDFYDIKEKKRKRKGRGKICC